MILFAKQQHIHQVINRAPQSGGPGLGMAFHATHRERNGVFRTLLGV